MSKKAIIISMMLEVCILLSACRTEAPKQLQTEYFFSSEGVTFTVGDDADEISGALGEPNSISKAPSCAGEGQEELYVYNGFRIYAHRDARACIISAIELTNDTVTTIENVRIGDKSEKIFDKYGNATDNNGTVEYVADGCILRFAIRDGRISGIKYLQNDS